MSALQEAVRHSSPRLVSLHNQFTRLDFTYYNYPIYNSSNFHYCGLEPNNNIVNYNNEQEVWTCQLDGLAEYVRYEVIVHSDVDNVFFFLLCHAFSVPIFPKFSLDALRASLATETEYVRAQLAAFTNTMLSLGVDGLRLDAAKRMSLCCFYFNVFCLRFLALFVDIQPKDITNIKARLKGTPYITQEVSKRHSVFSPFL